MTTSLLVADARTKKRNAAEKRFQAYGLSAIVVAMLALLVLLISVLFNGLSSFQQTFITMDIALAEDRVDKQGNRDPAEMAKTTTIGYNSLLRDALIATLESEGLTTDLSNKDIANMISKESSATVRNRVLANPDLVGQTVTFDVLASGRIDGFFKGDVTLESAALDQNTSPEALMLAQELADRGVMETKFNWNFFVWPDASAQRPEAAGLGGASLGALYMMIVVLVLALPIGVASSIYLEEFAPKNRITDIIEVNISNLAAVPSIVYGILGLAIFINFMEFNQSSPLVGGLVLTLMKMPTIIISPRAELKSDPQSIRDEA